MINSLSQIIDQDIFTILGLDHLPQEEKDALFAKAYDTVLHRALLRVADQLDDAQMEQLTALLGSDDEEAVDAFFERHGIDIDQIMISETLEYKTEMATLAETLKVADHQK